MPDSASFWITSSTPLTISGSSADVGSSNSMTSGSMAMARMIASLCFCPPDSFLGYSLTLSSRPTVLRSSMALASAASLESPFSSVGARVIFSMTVRCGKTLNCWKTMPIFCLWISRSVFFESRTSPSKMTCPPVGSSSMLRHLRNVLFPPPEGPMIVTTSPL